LANGWQNILARIFGIIWKGEKKRIKFKFIFIFRRKDLGVVGSFGGRNTPDEPITHQPVVFVHG
jgi:hypothetical protein